MKLRVTINLGNDAMRTGRNVSDALREVATRVSVFEDGPIDAAVVEDIKVKDVNGNTVGTVEVEERP